MRSNTGAATRKGAIYPFGYAGRTGAQSRIFGTRRGNWWRRCFPITESRNVTRLYIASGGNRKRRGRQNEMRGMQAGVSRNPRDIRKRHGAIMRPLSFAAVWNGGHGGQIHAAGNAAAVWRTVAGRKRARRMIATRSRIRRRAVAFRGGVWYNSHRCAAMGGEMPATERDNGTMKTFPRPVNGLPRPVAHFTRLRGAGFCK